MKQFINTSSFRITWRTLALIITSISGWQVIYAQAPQRISYQAIVRDPAGAILSDREVGLRFTIKNGLEGPDVYIETQLQSSNTFGLLTHQIGTGVPVTGIFDTIHWGDIEAWLAVDMDINGGADYLPMGISQLLSVPYALYAATGNPGPQGPPGNDGLKGDPGDPGQQGLQGLPGIDGINGANGTRWFSGSGAPPGTIGNVNDYYLDNVSGEYFIKSEPEAWSLHGTLKGPPGSSSGLPDGTAAGNTTWWNGAAWVTNSNNLYNNGSNIGISTSTPAALLHIRSNSNVTPFIIDANGPQTNANPLLRLRNALGQDLAWLHADDSTNLFAGFKAGLNNAILNQANFNTFLGSRAGMSNSIGYFNSALGADALFSNTTGLTNTAIGAYALRHNTIGAGNTALGANALLSNSTGADNTAGGAGSLKNNTTGAHNVAFGADALSANTITSDNTAVGFRSLFMNLTGHHNTATGANALQFNTSGAENAAFGASALQTNSSGQFNTAVGAYALTDNTGGSGNVAVGRFALTNNSTANNNTAVGTQSLESNGLGMDNTGIGAGTLRSNTAGNGNTALGMVAMTANTIGTFNTGLGQAALFGNVDGAHNTAVGSNALLVNSSGQQNTAIGTTSANKNTMGDFNTAVGYGAMTENVSGNFNTAVGHMATFSTGTLDNTAAIGFDAGGIVNSSNRIEIGNSSIGVIAGQVGFSTYSDARIKDNIEENIPGLDFINRLRPVSYNLNIHRQNQMTGKDALDQNWHGKYDIERVRMTGFLAQDVEEAARAAHYDFSGLQKPVHPDELYSIRYADFVMPLVKSVQEVNLKFENELQALQHEIGQLTSENEELKRRLERIEKLLEPEGR